MNNCVASTYRRYMPNDERRETRGGWVRQTTLYIHVSSTCTVEYVLYNGLPATKVETTAYYGQSAKCRNRILAERGCIPPWVTLVSYIKVGKCMTRATTEVHCTCHNKIQQIRLNYFHQQQKVKTVEWELSNDG